MDCETVMTLFIVTAALFTNWGGEEAFVALENCTLVSELLEMGGTDRTTRGFERVGTIDTREGTLLDCSLPTSGRGKLTEDAALDAVNSLEVLEALSAFGFCVEGLVALTDLTEAQAMGPEGPKFVGLAVRYVAVTVDVKVTMPLEEPLSRALRLTGEDTLGIFRGVREILVCGVLEIFLLVLAAWERSLEELLLVIETAAEDLGMKGTLISVALKFILSAVEDLHAPEP